MNTAGKVAGGSALVAVPATATTVAVYKDEIFGSSKSEEDTYGKFFYLLLRNTTDSNSHPSVKSWQNLKNECRNWTVTNSGGKLFMDRTSQKCAVIAAFNSNSNSDGKKYLSYFYKFKKDNLGDKEIDYSDTEPQNDNNYKKLFETLKSFSTEIEDQSKAKNDDWNPSKE